MESVNTGVDMVSSSTFPSDQGQLKCFSNPQVNQNVIPSPLSLIMSALSEN